jgi:hypothetical protein
MGYSIYRKGILGYSITSLSRGGDGVPSMAAWARQRLQEQQWRDSNPRSDAPVAIDAIGGALDTMASTVALQNDSGCGSSLPIECA